MKSTEIKTSIFALVAIALLFIGVSPLPTIFWNEYCINFTIEEQLVQKIITDLQAKRGPFIRYESYPADGGRIYARTKDYHLSYLPANEYNPFATLVVRIEPGIKSFSDNESSWGELDSACDLPDADKTKDPHIFFLANRSRYQQEYKETLQKVSEVLDHSYIDPNRQQYTKNVVDTLTNRKDLFNDSMDYPVIYIQTKTNYYTIQVLTRNDKTVDSFMIWVNEKSYIGNSEGDLIQCSTAESISLKQWDYFRSHASECNTEYTLVLQGICDAVR